MDTYAIVSVAGLAAVMLLATRTFTEPRHASKVRVKQPKDPVVPRRRRRRRR